MPNLLRLAGQAATKVPFLGDLINAGVTSAFGKYAGTRKAIPAGIMTGLGGAAASAATAGADFIPGMTDVVMSVKKDIAPLTPAERALANAARTMNPDRYIEKGIDVLMQDKYYDPAQRYLDAIRSMSPTGAATPFLYRK